MGERALELGLSFTMIDCASCDILFAITQEFETRRRTDGKGFYCPNGHPNVYGDSEVKLLKKAVEDECRRKENALAEANRLRIAAGKARAQTQRLKKRVSNGVCPCCNRSFVNMQLHMKTQHPEFQAA